MSDDKKLLVHLDLYGEGDSIDSWFGYIYNITRGEFYELREQYEHDGEFGGIWDTWHDFLDKKQVKYEQLDFDIDEY